MKSRSGSATVLIMIAIVLVAIIVGWVFYHYISNTGTSSYNPALVATSTASSQDCKNSATAIEATIGLNPNAPSQPSFSYYYNTQNQQCYLIEVDAPYYVNTTRMSNAMAYGEAVFDADSLPGKTLFGCEWYTPASSTQISTSSCYYFPNNETIATMTWEEYLNMKQQALGSITN